MTDDVIHSTQYYIKYIKYLYIHNFMIKPALTLLHTYIAR